MKITGDLHIHVIMDGVNYRRAVELHRNKVDISVIQRWLLFLSEEKYRIPADGGDARNVSYTAKKIAPEYGIDYRTLSLRFIRMVTMEELSDADSIPWKSTGSWFTR